MKKIRAWVFMSISFAVVTVITAICFCKAPSIAPSVKAETNSVQKAEIILFSKSEIITQKPKEPVPVTDTAQTTDVGTTEKAEKPCPETIVSDSTVAETTVETCTREERPSPETVTNVTVVPDTKSEAVLETASPEEEQSLPAPPAKLSGDSLFIGDSRTVGLMEYAKITDADFFCTIGMSVFNIHKKDVSVPGVGKVSLTELLKNKKYGKIHVMLGINELGYNFDFTVGKFCELISLIQSEQPGSTVIIQSNLHVTKNRSDCDKVINNPAIDRLNAELSKLADTKTVFYIDGNVLFDDANGALTEEKSTDSTHLYAKYYQEWGKWIVEQTASLIGEG